MLTASRSCSSSSLRMSVKPSTFSLRLLNCATAASRIVLSTSQSATMRTFFFAGVNIEAVAEGDTFPGRHGEIAGAGGFLFEIMQPERIGAEQAVIAHVPPGRVPRVLRMIENCDAHRLAAHRPVVVHPVRSFAPGRVVAH